MKKYFSFLSFSLACASTFAGLGCMFLGLYADCIGWHAGFDVFYGLCLMIAMGPMLLFGFLAAALDTGLAPYRRFLPSGKIEVGCIDPTHSGHLVPISESHRFHTTRAAQQWRREMLVNLKRK